MGSSTLMAGVALGAMSVSMPFGGFVGSRLVLRVPLSDLLSSDRRRRSDSGMHAAHNAPSRCRSAAADRGGGAHGPGYGDRQCFIRDRDPGQYRLVAARGGDVERVLLSA